MKKRVTLIVLSTLLTSGSLHPFIYQIIVLKRVNPTTGKTQQFIGLSDFHDKKNNANAAQLICIKKFLYGQNKATSKIILEDLSTDAKTGKYGGCRQFQINSRGGILGGLARSCKHKGLNVDNIEYRYCRVAALGPLLNNEHKKCHEFPSACGVRVCDIANEVHYTIADVTKYKNCCAALKTYRAKILEKIHPQMSQLKLTRDAKHSIADYVQQQEKKANRYELLKKLLIFDSALLDLKLAHSILTADTCDTIIAIAGGSHIARVQEIIQSAGYQVVYSAPGKLVKDPKPIDLSFLKKFGVQAGSL